MRNIDPLPSEYDVLHIANIILNIEESIQSNTPGNGQASMFTYSTSLKPINHMNILTQLSSNMNSMSSKRGDDGNIDFTIFCKYIQSESQLLMYLGEVAESTTMQTSINRDSNNTLVQLPINRGSSRRIDLGAPKAEEVLSNKDLEPLRVKGIANDNIAVSTIAGSWLNEIQAPSKPPPINPSLPDAVMTLGNVIFE